MGRGRRVLRSKTTEEIARKAISGQELARLLTSRRAGVY